MLAAIIAHINSLEANCRGDEANMVRVTAGYGSGSTLGTITFDVPIGDAKRLYLYIGQRLEIGIVEANGNIARNRAGV